MEQAYFRCYSPYGAYWKELKPTGRWMLSTHKTFTNRLFIEHRNGWFSKEWVSENDIEFDTLPEKIIFKCGKD